MNNQEQVITFLPREQAIEVRKRAERFRNTERRHKKHEENTSSNKLNVVA